MTPDRAILSGLLHNEEYARKVLPFIKSEYFEDKTDEVIYHEIHSHLETYNSLPSRDTIRVMVGKRDDLSQEQHDEIVTVVGKLSLDPSTDIAWLTDQTERFCQDKALYNAIRESIIILDEKHKTLTKGGIPELLTKALAVSFDNAIGHDFLEDSESRYEFYHRKENKVGFDLEMLNTITRGGLANKSLCVWMAGTGVGKTLFMTHCAAANIMHGKNVLYITMEMAEEMIAQRIDANLLDVDIETLVELPKTHYEKKVESVKKKAGGRLIIKEYPTASAGASHFRYLLQELRLKKNFVPDIIYVDYLNICTSSRLRNGNNINSYTYVKAIAEELRGLAVEFNVPLVTATQVNRAGFTSSDIGLEDTSESFGLPATADFMAALISSEELEKLNQIMVKQLKNRWNDPNKNRRFVIGINRAKMQLYDVEQKAQDDISKDDDIPVMDSSSVGERLSNENGFKRKKINFGGLQ